MSVLTVDSLLTALPEGVVVTDPATLENYRYDWSRDPGAGTPLGGGPPHRRRPGADRGPLVRGEPGADRAARRRHQPVRRLVGRQRRDRAVAGADARHRDRHHHPGGRGRTRRVQRRGQGRGGRARALVSPGPVVVRDLLDRRQHRHQRRRSVLREVRRHHRLRARTGRGAGRRRADHPRRQADQGRRRSLAAQAVRRLGGDARHHHPGRSCGCCRPSRPGRPWWPPSPIPRRPRARWSRWAWSPDRRWSS